MEEIKRPRGRPKLTEEEKARRKAERAQKKLQGRMPETKTVNRLPPEELKEIDRIQAIMAKADEAKRAQFAMPVIKEETEGNREMIVTIAPAKEFTIDDEYVRGSDKPDFVRKDDEGWVDPERA